MDYFCSMDYTEGKQQEAERLAEELSLTVKRLHSMGRYDLMLQAITVPLLEQLQIEAARTRLSRLVITADFRFILADYNKEITLTPVHKAIYILFLDHPEGIEFKDLSDYRDELLAIYSKITPGTDPAKIEETVNHLTDPTDNAINEKCSRIKATFGCMMDKYTLDYYMISSHTTKHFNSSSRVWFKRLKLITLPRELVRMDFRPAAASSVTLPTGGNSQND